MADKVPMTSVGYDQLNEELKKLKFEDRPAIVAAIEEARGHGDLSENAEYQTAREKQSFIEGRIQDLEAALSRAQVIDPKTLSGDAVLFGATVDVSDLDTDQKQTYQIVGQYEANLEKGLISYISPLAKALIGKVKGDIVEVQTPKGTKSYEVLAIRFV
ncbi:MAG: transcription elongation factor GreA [Alphaproteobacteria bacterium]|nr:transcription elongation factor GreA [Alphaproteobacteria bacterium]